MVAAGRPVCHSAVAAPLRRNLLARPQHLETGDTHDLPSRLTAALARASYWAALSPRSSARESAAAPGPSTS